MAAWLERNRGLIGVLALVGTVVGIFSNLFSTVTSSLALLLGSTPPGVKVDAIDKPVRISDQSIRQITAGISQAVKRQTIPPKPQHSLAVAPKVIAPGTGAGPTALVTTPSPPRVTHEAGLRPVEGVTRLVPPEPRRRIDEIPSDHD